jgi:hypothetical protein
MDGAMFGIWSKTAGDWLREEDYGVFAIQEFKSEGIAADVVRRLRSASFGGASDWEVREIGPDGRPEPKELLGRLRGTV